LRQNSVVKLKPCTVWISTSAPIVLVRSSSRSTRAHGISFICSGRNTPITTMAKTTVSPRKRHSEIE
jgi:transcription initiation factor TFIID subunit TAF12